MKSEVLSREAKQKRGGVYAFEYMVYASGECGVWLCGVWHWHWRLALALETGGGEWEREERETRVAGKRKKKAEADGRREA